MNEEFLKDKILIMVIGGCVYENNHNHFMAFVPVKRDRISDKCARALRRFGNMKKYGQLNTPSGENSPYLCLDRIEDNVVYRNNNGDICKETDRIKNWIEKAKNKETQHIWCYYDPEINECIEIKW